MSPSADTKALISVELHDDLLPLARRTRIGEAVRKAAGEELVRVGLPAAPSVFVRRGKGSRAVCVRVNGTCVAYPPQLLARAWQGSVPRDWHAAATTSSSGRFPDSWIREAAAGLPDGGLTKMMTSLVVALLRRRPELLLSDDVVAAYVGELEAIDSESAELDLAWGPILRPLVALTGTLADRRAVGDAIGRAVRMGLRGEDVVESAFAALRPGTLEVAWGASLPSDTSSVLKRRLLESRGLPAPELHVIADAPAHHARVCVVGLPGLPVGIIASDELLAGATAAELAARDVECIAASDPVTGAPAAIVSADRRDALERAGFATRDATSLVLDVLADALDEHRRRLLSISELEHQLAQLRGAFPAIVRATLATFPLADLTRIARVLVEDGISLTDLHRVLDRLLDYEASRSTPALAEPPNVQTNGGGSPPPTAEDYADGIRGGLADLFANWCSRDGSVDVVTVDGALEGRLTAGALRRNHDIAEEAIRDAAWALCAEHPDPPPVVITIPTARRPLSAILAVELPALIVLSHGELPLDLERRVVGTLATT